MDRLSKEVRSKVMARINGRNTAPEMMLRKAIYNAGLRGYRVHYRLPGKPDIVFTTKKLAIFVDGDFWHGYLWKRKKRVPPIKYWQPKILGNVVRDKKNNLLLRKNGWTVLRFWEHEVKKNPEKIIKLISSNLKK